MLRFLIALVVSFVSYGAQAVMCSPGPGNDLYGFYELYRESTYVVLATPYVVESSPRGERILALEIKKSWKKEPKGKLTISDSPDYYYLSAINGISDEEQVFFLEHGKDERISWICGQAAFPVQSHTEKSLNQISGDYAKAGLTGPQPPGGLICMRRKRQRKHENQPIPKMTARINDGVRIEISDTRPSFFANLNVETSHLMSIKENGVQVASFWFRFEPGEHQRCLYESHTTWKFSSKKCRCDWGDT